MSSHLGPNRLVIALLVVAGLVALPQPARAQCQFDASKTPADPPPSNLWNRLEPAYTTLPTCQQPNCGSRDTTWFDRGTSPWMGTPYWESIDIEQGYAFVATNLGFQIWTLNGGNHAEVPERLSYPDIRVFSPSPLPPGHGWYLTRDMDADASGNLAAITGLNLGMLIVDTASKNQPRVLYQDPGDVPGETEKHGWEVHTTTINGRVYGFLGGYAEASTSRDGVWAYDMTRAKELNPFPACVENVPNNLNCPGVYKGRISTKKVGHIDGAGDATDYFVVASGGNPALLPVNRWGFQIWKVNNVANGGPYPSVLTGHTNAWIDGVALWREGSRYLLAIANRQQELGQIYDVTCIKNNNCGSLSSLLLYQFPLAGANGDATTIITVQDSSNNGAPWVYFGRRNIDGVGLGGDLQNEWLFDVAGITASNPPLEITGGDPQNGNMPQLTMNAGGVEVGYWSYMYPCKPSGSNFMRPNGGIVYNNRFYRAGNSIFDIHRLVNVAPQIVVTGPSTGYTGQTLTFNAAANNCTPTPGGWSWTLTGTGGQVVSGGNTASAQIQWSQTGAKTVSASNTGCGGATTVAAAIQILNPAPAIGSVSASPANAPVCTPITFTGNNVTGQPPLSTNWTIEQGGDPVPGEGGPGNPFVWDTEGTSPGTYVGRLTVTGPGGSANAASPPVTLTALQPLPVSGYAITNDPPSFGTVQFHSAAATGATEWRWDFDGDPGGPNTFDLVTTDPVIGPNPVHDYTTIGTKHVWLEVRNCTTVVWVRSARLDVEITEVSPLLINDFRANCAFGVCSFNTGQAISFFHDVEGNPDTYEYDWTNDGNDPFQVEQSSTNPILTHTYTAPGAYRPILRVKRGAETVSFTHVATLSITTGGPPPSISVDGPTSLNIGQQGTFTAIPLNCTANPSDWTWNTSGGSGSSTSSSITVSWSSTGTKLVTAINSGCTGALGSRTVSVTDPGTGGPNPNPGGLAAAFTVSPEEPGVGQQVTFDAGTSLGNPTGFAWDFGDGTGGSGEEVTHTYSQPGVYEVGLTISKVVPGSGCGSFGQEICTDNATVDVTVGDGGGACVPNATTVCLLGGRFEVTAHWHNHRNGDTGLARVYTPFSGDRTGMFWFFSADNVELIVKSLDGTSFPNPAFWFFYGGLSDVEYWINVVDTVTDEEKEYHNEPDTICGVPDTGAFPMEPQTEEPEPVVTGGTALGAVGAFGDDDATFDLSVITGAGSSGTCTPNGNNLCLLDGRFSIEVDWHDHHNNNDGVGHPILGTDRTGYFWFFNSDNVELVAKFINGTSVNGHYWLLWGGLSDVQYTIRVTDTVTGTQKQWENPPGSFCGGAAANAFPAD